MKREVYEIAGVTVEICSFYEKIHQLCREYRSSGAPELTICVTQSHLETERKMASKQALVCEDDYLETLAVHRILAEHLLERNILLFHGSAVAVDGVAYLFTAPSGTGKSTHTRLWREQFGSRAVMVNDDKPLLKITDQEVLVFGSPWNGKHHLSSNISVPLKAICLLNRGMENQIAPITVAEALPVLLRQCFCPKNRRGLLLSTDLLDHLIKQVKLYRLDCNMNPEAALVSYQTMCRDES